MRFPRFSKLGILAGLLTLFALPCLAQESPTELSKFRMLLYDGRHIEGSHGQLSATEFVGTSKDGQEIRVAPSEIKILDVAGPSKSGKYAAYGALGGLATAGLAILQVQADPNAELNSSRVAPVTGALVGAGVLIGALVGANSSDWTPVQMTPAVGMSPDRTGLGYAIAISF